MPPSAPGGVALPVDANFSFSATSPTALADTAFPSFPFLASTITPDAAYDPTDSSTVSPTLSLTLTASRVHLHDVHLHGDSGENPLGEDYMMEHEASPPSTAAKGKRNADAMEEEDVQRRGPPEADSPGGDCKSLCVRHQRMANGGTNLMLQKSIESLPSNEQAVVNNVWSLFSSSPSRRRLLILRGLLTIACPSQLSFLQDCLTLEMRLDPVEVLPRELNLKVFGYLDAISLGRAAQVSQSWRSVADDDVLWRTMCEQHIERKCEKCGWGLPLLGERRRKKGKGGSGATKLVDEAPITPPPPSTVHTSDTGAELGDTTVRSKSTQPMTADLVDPVSSISARPTKRSKTESPAPSPSSTPAPSSLRPTSQKIANPTSTAPSTRPWKSVYCERLVIERNWRRGTYTTSVLSGHTDSVTCLQVAENLPHLNFPILMTGSWDRSVRIWNLESGKEVGVLRGHTRGVRALQFDAGKLVTGSMDSTLKIWNWRTGECMRTLRGHGDAVICLTYDKQLLVSGSADSTIRVWDFGTGEVYTLRGHTDWVNSVALWDSNTACATTPASALDGDLGPATKDPEAAKASCKGKFLVSASDDMTIRVWDLYTRECVRVLKGHVAQVQSIRVITTDGATPTFPPSMAPSDPSSTTPLPSGVAYPASGALAPPDVAALPDLDFAGEARPQIISASLDNTIKVWNVEKGVAERTLFGHIEGVWDVAVDKLRIVSASHDRTLKIWDKDTGKCLHTLVGHTSAVTALTLKDSFVVSGGDDGNARVWRFS